jgi:hypothetical protein
VNCLGFQCLPCIAQDGSITSQLATNQTNVMHNRVTIQAPTSISIRFLPSYPFTTHVKYEDNTRPLPWPTEAPGKKGRTRQLKKPLLFTALYISFPRYYTFSSLTIQTSTRQRLMLRIQNFETCTSIAMASIPFILGAAAVGAYMVGPLSQGLTNMVVMLAKEEIDDRENKIGYCLVPCGIESKNSIVYNHTGHSSMGRG